MSMISSSYNIPWAQIAPYLGLTFVLLFCIYPFALRIRQTARSNAEAKSKFLTDAKGLIKAGLAQASIFKLVGENGPKTILAPKYAKEISDVKALSFARVMTTDFHSHINGFDPFSQFEDYVFQDAVRTKMTQALGSVTGPLAEETTLALEKNWTDYPEWHHFSLKPTVLSMIAQLSSRVFLGDQICRNPEWLRITVDYTMNSFRGSEELRLWPKFLRPLVARFQTSAKKVHQDLQGARDIIQPVLNERRKIKEKAATEGVSPPYYNDAMEWMEQTSRGRPYDPVAIQLTFSVVAVHTSSDMVTQAIYDLCGREELVKELREEIISVLPEEGWKKTALNKLHLMDSFLKESQRVKPINIITLKRIAEDNVELKDGTKIAKGTSLFVPNDWMWDSAFYENPETFDPYRFLKLRATPGYETRAQLISPAAEHLGFGLGSHACPGRFFAVNEIKILLCHILLKYDFKLQENTVLKYRKYGCTLHADSQAHVMIRRRRQEIDLENLFT